MGRAGEADPGGEGAMRACLGAPKEVRTMALQWGSGPRAACSDGGGRGAGCGERVRRGAAVAGGWGCAGPRERRRVVRCEGRV